MRLPLFGKDARKREELRYAGATFVIGIGVMAVEITASRLLAPYFGASMFVWTSLIVTVLVALSLGYYLGGNAAGKGIGVESVGLLAAIAAALLVLGMLVLPRFSSAITGLLIDVSGATVVLFVGSLVVTMVVFAAPVFFTAMSGPILLKAWSALGDIGTISGRYFAISTAGSVIGTVAPTLILVPMIGSRDTMFAVAAMFILLALALAPRRRKMLALVGLGLLFVAVFAPRGIPADVIAQRESPYQLIRVAQKDDGRRYLVFNEGAGIQSMYVPDHGRTNFYFDYAAILPLLRPHPTGTHSALIIGLAGGTTAARYRAFMASGQDVRLIGVEIDPTVIAVAKKYFDLAGDRVGIVNADGRVFLQNGKDSYDVILVDAYSTQLYIPPHLATREFFSVAKSRLAAGGVFAMNVNAPSEDSPLLKGLANTVAGVFRYVTVIPVRDSWNHILLASDEPFDLTDLAWQIPAGYQDMKDSVLSAYSAAYRPDVQTFTDDRAPVEFLTDSMVLEQAWQTIR